MFLPRHAPRAQVVLAYLTFVLVGVEVGVGGVLLPAQSADYGIGKATIGLIFFTFSAGFSLGGFTSGPLIHRVGVRATLGVGGAVSIVAALAIATRPPFVVLLAVQALVGYGNGLMESVFNAHLARLPSSTTLLNRLHAFFGVGALLGPQLAVWMVGFAHWTVVWLVLGLACLPLLAGFLIFYPRREIGTANPAAEGVTAADPPRAGLLSAALRLPAVLLGSAFLSVYVGLEIGVGNWEYSFLVEGYAFTSEAAGLTASGYWLGLTAGRFLISPVATRAGLSATAMSMVCLIGVTLVSVVIWAVPVSIVAGVCFALLGFFLGPLFPTAMAVVPQITPERLVPTAIGLMNAFSVVGGSTLPWLAGALADGVGVWTLMPFAFVLSLIQLVIWWMISVKARSGVPV